jgi:hypothetical protein
LTKPASAYLDTSTLEHRADACGGGLGESVVERMGDDQKRTQGRLFRFTLAPSA